MGRLLVRRMRKGVTARLSSRELPVINRHGKAHLILILRVLPMYLRQTPILLELEGLGVVRLRVVDILD